MKSPGFDAHLFNVYLREQLVEQAFAHDLGRIPFDAFVLNRTKGAVLFRGTTAWTSDTIYLRATESNVGFRIMLFGGGETPPEGESLALTRAVQFDLAGKSVAGATVTTWPDGATNDVRLFSIVPPDYNGGDLTIKLFRRGSSSGGGTAIMRRNAFRFRDATAFSQLDTTVSMNYTDTSDTNTHLTTWTYSAASFQVGDTIRIDVDRLGADAGDTYAGSVSYDGMWMEYSSTQ